MSDVSGRSDPDPGKLLRLATTASIATAAGLVVVKLAGWLTTGSVSILASMIDSLMDVGASFVNLLAVRYSLAPPDDEHRFGHGKAEALAGLGQAMFITGSAVFLLLYALDRLREPVPLDEIGIGVVIMVVAIGATLALILVQRFVIKRTQSTAIRADSLHYTADLMTNAATIGALVISAAGFPVVDAVFAIGIAIYVLYSAGRIAKDAVDLLMDRELPESERELLRQTVLATEGVHGMHGLRTWRSRMRKVLQLHINLDPTLSLHAAHQIAVEVEERLLAIEPEADVTIHQDPLGLDEHSNPADAFRDETP